MGLKRSRKQFEQINNVKSELLNITCGVPQGSVLGAQLFVSYINDIVHVSKMLNRILSTDDTIFFYSGKILNRC